jgi:Tol biopolymer transport system component
MKNVPKSKLILSTFLVALLLGFIFGRQAGATTLRTSLVSADNTGIQGDAASTLSFISADGHYVVFQSDADNLVPGITSTYPQVYLRDLRNNTTSLISSNSAGTGAGNGISGDPTISADGSMIAFHSQATDLISGGISNSVFHIYVYNRTTGLTTLISKNSSNSGPCNESSGSPYISADGNYVAFHSYATDLVTETVPGGTVRQIYLRDLTTATTTLISKNNTDGNGADGTCETPAVSADGSNVTFHSTATNLVSGASGTQVYLRTFTGGSRATTQISQGDAASGLARISADGRYIVFQSNSTNLVTGGTNLNRYHVYLYDRDGSGTTTLLSRARNGTEGDENSGQPFISPDGRYVAFSSKATNLTDDNVDGTEQHIFIRDILSNKTTLATVSSSGTIANNSSATPSISTDGKFVTFESIATNLTTPSSSGQQIFVHSKQGMNLLFMILPQLAAHGAANP